METDYDHLSSKYIFFTLMEHLGKCQFTTDENYVLRYNVLKQTEEYRRKEPLIAQQVPLIRREESLIQAEEPKDAEQFYYTYCLIFSR
jgi:hypothetical protein